MNRLRVCHIIHDTNVGGAETMLLEVLRRLADTEVESSVVSLLKCGATGKKIRQLGVPMFALEGVRRGIPRPHRAFSLVRHLRALRPDVVQTWAYHADLCGGIAARLAGSLGLVWNIRHGTLDPTVDSRNTLRSAHLCARLSKSVPAKILLNSHAALAVHENAGYDHTKMQVIPNGFDTQRFRPLPDDARQLRKELGLSPNVPLVGMAGRFHLHKGQHDFVKAARQILCRHPGTRFLMVGDGCEDTNAQLVAWLQAHRVRDDVLLLGCRDDMPSVLNALDVCVLPSITEGMPNIVGEAMSCQTACVVTDVGDAKRLLGDTGSTVGPRDPDALAHAVSELLAQPPSQRESLAARARARITRHFDILDVAAQYVSTWHEVASISKARSARGPQWYVPAWFGGVFRRAESVEPAAEVAGVIAPDTGFYRPKLVHVTTIPMTQWLFLRGQNAFMQQQGFDVHAVSSPGSYMRKLRDRDRVSTHTIPISRRIEPIRDFVSMVRLWRLFRRLRPEIVQLSTPKAALLGAVAAWLARVPIRIYQIRGLSSESEIGWKRRLFQRLEQQTALLCNGCLVNVRSLLEYARHAGIVRNGDGHVAGMGMSNGVDLARFDTNLIGAADLRRWAPNGSSKNINGPVIGFVGRLTRDKGLEDLFAAWSNLRDDYPDARLLLVGPWEVENAPSATCREGFHADPRVLLVGTQDDVASFYRAMDMFVFASHGTEGFPNAPMEAAAMGVPVIATRVVGCVDAVVDGVTGQVVSPREPAELEAAIRAYLNSTELRRRHGQAGQARVRTGFAPPLLWKEFRAYYQTLLVQQGLALPTAVDDDRDLPQAA